MKANLQDVEHLSALYAGRRAFFGDLHNHSASTERSDGKRSMAHWKGALEALKLDFAALLDHGQAEHMHLPDWEDGVFIGGTEPGTRIVDSSAADKHMHYNMLFENAAPLEALLDRFPEYQFTGGLHGRFIYPEFTTERFGELIDCVRELGGLFVHPHPKQLMQSDNPLDYWFRDETGLEVFYGDMRNADTAANYRLWCDLLALGKHVWATGGNDNHACAEDTALTCIYSEDKKNAAYLAHLREGDCVCGSVGIRMCVGDVKMGGKGGFDGKRLVICVDDFHRSVRNPEHRYRLDLLDDKGVVFSGAVSCEVPNWFAMDAGKSRFYRAEVVDENLNLRIALGNPIWNE